MIMKQNKSDELSMNSSLFIYVEKRTIELMKCVRINTDESLKKEEPKFHFCFEKHQNLVIQNF